MILQVAIDRIYRVWVLSPASHTRVREVINEPPEATYEPMPAKRTFTMQVKMRMRGRGKPLPYPHDLIDDDSQG